MKIAFVGGPGLGKTTIAMDTAAALKKDSIVAGFVAEYARTWMAKHGRTPRNVEDQAMIMRGQRKREAEASLTQDVIVTDSTTWMCAIYASLYLRNSAGKIDYSGNVSLNDLFEDAIPESDGYDLTFVLPRCFGMPVEPGRMQISRSEGERMDAKIAGFVSIYDIPAVFLSTNPKKWLSEAMPVIREYMGL